MPKHHHLWEDPNLPSDKATDINRDRMKTYGSPVPVLEMAAQMWSSLFSHWITAEQVAAAMILLKVAREQCGGYDADYRDNLEDVCGFSNVLYVIKEAHANADAAADGASE